MEARSRQTPSTSSGAYLSGLAGAVCTLGVVALLLTGERAAGIGELEPIGLGAAAVLFAAATAATIAGSAGTARWLGRAGVVVAAALFLVAFTEPGWGSAIFLEGAGAVIGLLFVVSSSRRDHP